MGGRTVSAVEKRSTIVKLQLAKQHLQWLSVWVEEEMKSWASVKDVYKIKITAIKSVELQVVSRKFCFAAVGKVWWIVVLYLSDCKWNISCATIPSFHASKEKWQAVYLLKEVQNELIFWKTDGKNAMKICEIRAISTSPTWSLLCAGCLQTTWCTRS